MSKQNANQSCTSVQNGSALIVDTRPTGEGTVTTAQTNESVMSRAREPQREEVPELILIYRAIPPSLLLSTLGVLTMLIASQCQYIPYA